MRAVVATVLTFSGTLAAVVPRSLLSSDYGEYPSAPGSSYLPLKHSSSTLSTVPVSSAIPSASFTSTSISKPATTSKSLAASAYSSSTPVAVGYNSTSSYSDQATTLSLTLTQSSITLTTSSTVSTKTYTSPPSQSSSYIVHSPSTARSPVTLSSASYSEPTSTSTSTSSKHSEPASGPIAVTVYDTTTVTASPTIIPEPSTVTLTTSVITTRELCQTSLSITISSGRAFTYTITVYKAATRTLTSKLPRQSSETINSSTPTPLSLTSSEATSTFEVTLTITTHKTYSSTISLSSAPETIIFTQTRLATSTLRSTIPQSLPKYSISDNSTKVSPVVPASTVTSISPTASTPPATQIYSLLSQSHEVFVTLSISEPITPTVTPFSSVSLIGSFKTLASAKMGNTPSMALSSSYTGTSTVYNVTLISSTPNSSRVVSTLAEVSSVSIFTHKPRQANSSTTTSAASAYVSTISGMPIGSGARPPPAFIAESAVLAISTTTVIPELAAQSSRRSSPDLVPAFLGVKINSSASTSTQSTLPTAASGIAKLSSTARGTPSRSSAAPSSTSCGESGDFTLTWDDEPNFDPGPNTTTHMFPPVFNPYHHFFFASGYSYLDDQTEAAFSAVTEPTLALWLVNQTDADTGSPNAGSQGPMALMPGEIGAGPRAWSNAYWFNATEGYFGCLADGPGVCHLAVNGYIWDEYNKVEQPYASTIYNIPTCPDYKNCRMTHIRFQGQDYTGLSGIQFQMYQSYMSVYAPLRTQWRDFVMDSLSLGWYNNTCEAGLLRITQRK